jgi:hypothetical protein
MKKLIYGILKSSNEWSKMKNYRAIFQISIVIFLLFTAGCQFLNKTSPSDTVATLQGGIEGVKPEIEQQLTHLPATLESLATQYAPTVDSLVTAIPATAESIIMPTEAPSSSYEGEVALVESENLAFKLPREVAEWPKWQCRLTIWSALKVIKQLLTFTPRRSTSSRSTG